MVWTTFLLRYWLMKKGNLIERFVIFPPYYKFCGKAFKQVRVTTILVLRQRETALAFRKEILGIGRCVIRREVFVAKITTAVMKG